MFARLLPSLLLSSLLGVLFTAPGTALSAVPANGLDTPPHPQPARDIRPSALTETIRPGLETAGKALLVESAQNHRSAPRIHARVAATDPASSRHMLTGMLYGALALIILYSVFLALSVRERSYFYYLLHALAVGVLLAAAVGYPPYSTLSGDGPGEAMATAAFAVALLFFFLFATHFLQLQRHHSEFHYGLLLLTIAAEVLIFSAALWGEHWALRAALVATGLVYLGALVAALRRRIAGMSSAGYFALAIIALFLGLISANLNGPDLRNVIDGAAITGALIMLVLFSLALADRINQLRTENRSAHTGIAKANEQAQRINAELSQARDEHQRLEESIAHTREESRAKSSYLTTLSHQIRTPMSSIMGMAELLKESPLDGSQLHYVYTIERAGKALVEIISELLEFAEVESGRLQLAVEPFDLQTVVDDCLSILSLAALERRVNLIADIDPALPRHLRGDARKLQQVLLNLLGNAIRFTDGGDVVLKVSRSERPAVNGVELRFDVTDTGIGIKPEQMPQLFTPFTAEGGPSSDGRRAGLGLPISKQLVELMDGDIGVESTPGEGSRFWFTVRCMLSRESEIAPERTLAGRRILLVEAHPTLAESLEHMLTAWGARVQTVIDASGAQKALVRSAEQAQLFDVALIDHQLPSGSGLSLAAEIAGSDLPTPPMILMTSATQSLSNRELEASEVEIVLEKPLTYHQVQDALERALGQAHRQQQMESQPTPLRGIRVLVAEDNSVNQMVVATLLRKLGAEPILVTDGLAAVQAVKEDPPDAVLMDCEMPELDGYQASRQIRNWERREGRPPLPIIALSAHATSDHRQLAQDAGIDDYLTKPVTRHALETSLRRARERGHPRSG